MPLSNGCIEWLGTRMWKGYGRFWYRGRFVRAHRFAYQLIAPIPHGKVLDHLCGNRLCVNPLHLEPVTPRENIMRSAQTPARINSEKTHCPKGHAYDVANTALRNSKRDCRACGRVETRRYLATHRDAHNARRRAARARSKA